MLHLHGSGQGLLCSHSENLVLEGIIDGAAILEGPVLWGRQLDPTKRKRQLHCWKPIFAQKVEHYITMAATLENDREAAGCELALPGLFVDGGCMDSDEGGMVQGEKSSV